MCVVVCFFFACPFFFKGPTPPLSAFLVNFQVEPCFRVSSNRDGVLLGLVHALGGRLSCSSAHDIKAGVRAARRASPIPAPPPRLLDRHVCRSPVLLRASVAAGVQLYEVRENTVDVLPLDGVALFRFMRFYCCS